MSPRSSSRRGAALLLVIAVIVALVVIAAPFALSMRLHERSSKAYAAQSRARHAARAGRNLALRQLLDSHAANERLRDKEQPDGESYDSAAELAVRVRDLQGISGLETNDPRGLMVDVSAVDEQGKLDLNTASPFALGAALGVTRLAKTVGYDEEKFLEVDDTSPFFSDGDPRTIDGVLYAAGEFIAYRHTTPTRFEGLIRGLYLSQPLPFKDGAESIAEGKERLALPPGQLVYDARGWKIASQQLWSILSAPREGRFSDFPTVSSVKGIADWDFGRLRLGLSLLRYGLDATTLRRWGLAGQLKRAGLDAAMFERAPEKLSDDAFARQQETEDRLAEAGLPVETLKELGSAILTDAARQLDASEGDARKRRAVLRRLSERIDQARSLKRRQLGWLKGELALTLRHMITLASSTRDLGTIGRIEFEELRPLITAHAQAPAGRWTDPAVVLAPVPYHPEQPGARLTVQDTRYVAPGMLARITPVGGGAALYRRVVSRSKDAIVVLPKLNRSYGARALQVSVRLPSPLNVNTATREALAAVFTGLAIRGGKDQVDCDEAAALAALLVAREEPIKNHVELAAALSEAAAKSLISAEDALAIARCAINPADPRLKRWTAPLSFASQDVYTIEATGISNGPAGRELGRYATREVVQVAPSRLLTLSVDSQADFEHQRAFLGGRSFLPQRHKGLLTSFPKNIRRGEQPSRSHADDVGELKLQTWEVADVATIPGPGRGVTRHFRDQLLGAAAPQALPPPALRLFQPDQRVSSVQVELLQPGAFRGWFRLDQLPGPRAILFDIGDRHAMNRLVCFYDVDKRELVFRAYDESLDEQESQALSLPERRSVEVRGPVDLKPGNWYHLTLVWRGASYSDLLALVDNKIVTGKETYATRLSQDIDDRQLVIPVEDASLFPSEGVALIGGGIDENGVLFAGEAVHYVARSATSLRVESAAELMTRVGWRFPPGIQRPEFATQRVGIVAGGSFGRLFPYTNGARPFGFEDLTLQGRIARGAPHRRGCPVTILGGRARLSRGGAAAPGEADILMADGARLGFALPEHTPLTLLYRPPNLLGSDAEPPRVNSERPEEAIAIAAGETKLLPCVWLAAYPDPGLNIGGFPPQGILQVGSVDPEYIGYTGIDLPRRCFTGLVRGMFNSRIKDHRFFEPAVLASLTFTGDLSKYGLPAGGDRVIISLHQDNRRFEWLDLLRVRHPAFPRSLRFKPFAVPRPTFPIDIDKDSRWAFMTTLVRSLSPSSVLPDNITTRPITGRGKTMILGEWLKDIEPFPSFRGSSFSGLGALGGGNRGPGLASPRGTPALPVVRLALQTLLPEQSIITLIDDRLPEQREEARISNLVFEFTLGPLMSLSGFTSRDFSGADGARLVKWPSGLLKATGPVSLGAPSPKLDTGAAQDAAITGRMDELQLIQIEAPKGAMAESMAPTALNFAKTERVSFLPKGSKLNAPAPILLKAGSEILALSKPESGVTVRGLLGSEAGEIAAEEAVWRLDVPAIALAKGSYEGGLAERFRVRPGGLNGFPKEDGYVAIDRGYGAGPFDVIAYKRRRGAVFERPLDRFGRGFADHNFGSGGGQGGLGLDDILVETPVRFHDRYEEGRSGLDATLFSFSRTIPGARFESIDWEVEHPNPYTQIVVRVRVDGAPNWEAPRQNAAGDRGLFVFKDPADRATAAGEKRRRHLIRKRGDQIDVQVYLTFKPRAFFEDAWKQTPVLKSLKIRYYQPTRTRAHEER